jgi:hypothetical protein
MDQYVLYQSLNFTTTAKARLQSLLRHHHLELGFDQVRVYGGQKSTQIFAHGSLRILAEDYAEKEGQIVKKTDHIHLYEFTIPPFIYCKEQNHPAIEVIHHLLSSPYRPDLSTVSGHTPFSLSRIFLYYLREHTKEYSLSKVELQRSYLLDPTIKLPDVEIGTVTLFIDLLSYIVMEGEDGDQVIIEILDVPESYAIHFNDKALRSSIDTRINEDTGEPLYQRETLE